MLPSTTLPTVPNNRMRLTRGSLRLLVASTVLVALYFQFFVLHILSHNEIMSADWALSQAAAGPNLTRRNNIVTSTSTPSFNTKEEQQAAATEERCAINIYGLPRAFASIVLPSLVRNVIKPNAAYNCDYFIHYYNLTTEVSGRSGQGGDVNPQEILLLREQVLQEHAKAHPDKPTPTSSVIYAVSQEGDFWKQYSHLIHKIHNAKDADGNYLYFPWKAKTYTFPTTVDNIIKMWHSIQSVWNLMDQYALDRQYANNIKYTRVAMLRADVMYLTPIDIWTEANGIHRNIKNDQAVIPGFGRHPVSDRLIYGPYDAVKPWANMRFRALESHVEWMQTNDPGWAMHSERFVNYTIIPRIQKLGYQVTEHDTMCFFRARADESVWITDCSSADLNVSKVTSTLPSDIKGAVQRLLGRKCGEVVNITRTFQGLPCPQPTGEGVYNMTDGAKCRFCDPDNDDKH
jgi:hypothetical protein